MKVKYIEEGETYVIANHAVAKNAIFRLGYYKRRLERQIMSYLSPVCSILSVVIHEDQFQLVVKMYSRQEFRDFYINKRLQEKKEVGEIPESTYIFSQIMANLQSSIAIHFNRKEDRTGAVFARRFTKFKILGEEALKQWLTRIKEKVKFHKYSSRWSSRNSFKRRELGIESRHSYRNQHLSKLQLQGQSTEFIILTTNSDNYLLPPP